MQVKYVDGELERIEHKLFIGTLPKSSLFGAMPVGYMLASSYNGYGYQAPGTYELMQYPLPALSSHQPGLHVMVAVVNPGNTLTGGTPDPVGGITPTNFAAIQSTGYMSSAYPAVFDVQYAMAYQGPMIGHGTLPAAHGSIGTTLLNINTTSGNVKTSSDTRLRECTSSPIP